MKCPDCKHEWKTDEYEHLYVGRSEDKHDYSTHIIVCSKCHIAFIGKRDEN